MMTEEQFLKIFTKVDNDLMDKHADVVAVDWEAQHHTKERYGQLSEHVHTVIKSAIIAGMKHGLEHAEVMSNELIITAKSQGITREDLLKYMKVNIDPDLWDKL